MRLRQTLRLGLSGLLICAACDASPLAVEEASFTARVAQTQTSRLADITVDSVAWRVGGTVDAGTAVLHPSTSMRTYIEQSDGSYLRADDTLVEAGRKILVWTDGVVGQTLPPSYHVRQILLLR
jgi:hypothetical protein